MYLRVREPPDAPVPDGGAGVLEHFGGNKHVKVLPQLIKFLQRAHEAFIPADDDAGKRCASGAGADVKAEAHIFRSN